MNIFAIVGYSNSGKTRLTKELISELKSRGYSAAVIKHCPHGFDIDLEDKDSWNFLEAGSDAVSIVSPDRLAVLQKQTPDLTFRAIAAKFFKDIDIILVEGGRNDSSLKKIEVLRKGISEKVECSPKELMAVISDLKIVTDKPLYHPDQIGEIASFIENYIITKKSRFTLDIDGASIPVNKFVRKIFKNIILGMISSLDRIKENPESITLSLRLKKKKDGKA